MSGSNSTQVHPTGLDADVENPQDTEILKLNIERINVYRENKLGANGSCSEIFSDVACAWK